MQPRIKSPLFTLPGTLDALHSIHKATQDCGVPHSTFELMNLRASQINSCSVCVDMHSRALLKMGEKPVRVFAAAAWREAPYYSDAERAALALAESISRIADRPDPVPDDVWNEAARHYTEPQLSALVMQCAVINLFNRLNAATRQPTGDFVEQFIR
jgi:AhpD family alkylhydroperoxidase